MKNLFKLFLVSILLFSCSDAYDIAPDDEVLEDNAYNSVSDLERGINGVYAGISGTNIISWSSIFTDDLMLNQQNRGQGVQVHTWSIVPGTTESTALWVNLYSVINRANRLLEAIDSVTAANTDEEEIKNRIKAECLAIRAMSHFDLYRLYTEDYTDMSSLSVPVVQTVTVFEQPARNTVSEVLTAIKEDLQQSENLLDASYTEKTRFNVNAINALRARVALYEGDYENAITYSTLVIDSEALANTTEFPLLWTDESDQEVVFKLARTNGDGAIGTVFRDTNGDIFFGMSQSMLDHINSSGWTGDVRTFSNIDVDNFDADEPLVGKYLGTEANYGLNDIKLFRISEQYLIRAEANVRKSSMDLAAASLDIETLRNARKFAPTTVNYSNMAIALEDILGERRMELAYEGHRYFDLKRYQLDVDRTQFPVDCQLAAGACTLDSDNYKFTLPIPQSELFANDNMVQNTGY